LGILNDFERRLEGIIEGLFSKAFKSGLHPVELATRILKEMEANKSVRVRGVWVPNHYTFHLSTADHARFDQTEGALRRELQQVVVDAADERNWGLVGPPEVRFEVDPSLPQGKYRCDTALVEGPTDGQPTPQPSTRPARDGRAAELVLIDRGAPGRRFPLLKDRSIIGRLAESDVVIADPGTSRRHAEVRREDGEYVISDLGSTNGTMVNESTVAERTLQEGDRITIGRTVLEFRRR
jgi:hypothetical protein